jgi:hypothetical protein
MSVRQDLFAGLTFGARFSGTTSFPMPFSTPSGASNLGTNAEIIVLHVMACWLL